jgi:hypothetical protein
MLCTASGKVKKRTSSWEINKNMQESQGYNNGKRDMLVVVTRRQAKPTGKPL